MASTLEIDGLLALLDARETVLLPNARAARAVREAWHRRERTRGLHVWEAPSVLGWSEWVESLWSPLVLTGLDDRVLLNRLQEESLWAEIIATEVDQATADPASVPSTGKLARSALALAAGHEATGRLTERADSPDARSFAGWFEVFSRHCRSRGLLSRALLEAALTQHLCNGGVQPPSVLHLAGFDRLLPSSASLLDGARGAGCAIVPHALTAGDAHDARHLSTVLPDPREELRWATRWVRERVVSGFPDRPQSLALILPDPPGERGALEPLLREYLAPELVPVGVDLSSQPWHFSAGRLLSSLPLVQDALLLLRWTIEDLPAVSAGRLILSPFLGHSDPFEARARFEMHGLRRGMSCRPEIDLDEALRRAAAYSGPDKPEVTLPELRALRRVAGDPGRLSGTGMHADWTELIRRFLRTVAWPGPRSLSPQEFRALELWESLLDRLATVDYSGERTTLPELLDLLAREAADTPVPDLGSSPTLEILTLAEAEGCCFDAALVLRATDGNLPPPKRANPLLGWGLQKELGLPGTDPVLASAQARGMLSSLALRCGDLLLLSSAADDTGELRPTALGAELGFSAVAPHELLAPAPADDPPVLERSPELLPLPPLPSNRIGGGARVLELQAACGFRAFASLRLRASVPEDPGLGLDARATGNLLHRAMELLWKELESQAKLKAMDIASREKAVRRAVNAAFASHAGGPLDAWSGAYLRLLQDRFCHLIERWLEQELKRDDFTVLSPEQGEVVEVGPLELSIRPDRVDRVEGGVVFVDYKSTLSLSTADWRGERPAEPQLPLYTLLGEAAEVRGVAFARLAPGKPMGWLSLQDRSGLFPDTRDNFVPDFAEEIEAWRLELGRLATRFAEGDTQVDPKSYPNTCQFCSQRPLCRLDPEELLRAAAPVESTKTGGADG